MRVGLSCPGARFGVAVLLLLMASSRGFAEQHEYIVKGYRSSGGEALCHPFKLTRKQVKQFFTKARPISAADLHDKYDYLPCWVEGTRQTPQGTWRWKIHPVGVAEVKLPNGTNQFWGCESCDDLFK